MKGLLEFILNVDSIEGTLVHRYLKIAVSEASPKIYVPRQGKVAGNFNRIDQLHLDFLVEFEYKYLRMFGYY